LGEISEALRRARAEGTPGDARTDAYEGLVDSPPEATGPSVLIPDSDEGAWYARAVVVESHGTVAEHYRHFALRVSRELLARQARTLVVTSAMRAEGKTTTACNLALAMASMAGGKRIALVEADLRRPSISSGMGVVPGVGFEAVLTGAAKLRDARTRTNIEGFDLFLVRNPVQEVMPLLSSTEFAAALRELGRQYDTVVVDTPPVLPVPDVPLIQVGADAIVIVARSGICRRQALREMLSVIQREKVIGAFLNDAGNPRRNRYYGDYTSDEDERGSSGSRS